MPQTKTRTTILREPAQLKCTMDISEDAVYAKICNENAPDQDLDNPAAQTLCEPTQSKCTWTSQKELLLGEFTLKMPETKTGTTVVCVPAQWKCTLTSQKELFLPEVATKFRRPRPGQPFSLKRNRLCKNLQWTCRRPRPGNPFRASLRSWNAHGHLRRDRLRENLQWQCSRPRPWQPGGADLVRACVFEIYMDVAQGHFLREFT